MVERTEIPPVTNLEDPRYVKALAHPLRLRLLALLGERDASPVQLAEYVDASLGTVAYHVRTLERLGMIEMVATHQRRGATEHVYAARAHPRFSDRAWSQSGAVAQQVMTASVLSQIGQYATQSAAAGGFDREDAHCSRTSLRLDEEGWAELAAATETWLAQVRDIEQRAQRRIRRTGERVFDAGLVVLFFEAVPLLSARAGGNGATPDVRGAKAAARRNGGQRRAAASAAG